MPADLLDPSALPDRFESVEALDDFLTRPTRALVDDLAMVEGDLVILGVAGKMGPTLARLAKRAGPARRVIGVARFSDPAVRDRLDADGVETIACDLLDRTAVASLPDAPNVIFAAGKRGDGAAIEEVAGDRLDAVLGEPHAYRRVAEAGDADDAPRRPGALGQARQRRPHLAGDAEDHEVAFDRGQIVDEGARRPRHEFVERLDRLEAIGQR